MVSRRGFLGRISTGAMAGATLPALLNACAKFRYVSAELDDGRLAFSLASFGDGPYALVHSEALPMPVYLYRHESGEFTAVLTTCMHQGCQVEPVQGHLVCPCHGSEYDNRGAVLKGPTERPLIRYPVQVEGDRVFILIANAEEVAG